MIHKKRFDLIEVLAVDDEKLILRLVHDTLVRNGFRAITFATNGRQAMDLVAERPFDIIISDWRMDHADGMDVVRFVRQSISSTCPRASIIMLTGVSDIIAVRSARDAGINEYLIKPFSAEQLMLRVRGVIEKPKSFVTGPTYQGPDRRHIEHPPPDGKDRRRRRGRRGDDKLG